MFKKIIASTLAISALGAPAALAEDIRHYDVTIGGYYAPYVLESPTRGEYDGILVDGPAGREQIVVRCAPFDWEAKGPNSSEFVNHIARSWCFGS